MTVTPTEKISYYNNAPESATVFFINGDNKTAVNIDFSNKKMTVDFAPSQNETGNFTVKCDNSLLAYFTDTVSGINVSQNGKFLRITGVQIEEYLKDDESFLLKQSIITEIIKGISVTGFSKENLLYIIENFEGNLSLKDSFNWVEFIPELCETCEFLGKGQDFENF